MTLDTFDLYQKLSSHRVYLAFKGAVSQDILVELGDLLKNRLIVDKKVKKVFAVFVEMSQNILHYSAEKGLWGDSGEQVGIGIILVTEDSDCYFVTSGNKARIEQAERLKSQCDYVNSLSVEELKRYYNQRRKGAAQEGSKGAGLGFIDMARKSDRPLEYSINLLDDEHVFFILTITIEKGQ